MVIYYFDNQRWLIETSYWFASKPRCSDCIWIVPGTATEDSAKDIQW